MKLLDSSVQRFPPEVLSPVAAHGLARGRELSHLAIKTADGGVSYGYR